MSSGLVADASQANSSMVYPILLFNRHSRELG
jgi:hypothetical protein